MPNTPMHQSGKHRMERAAVCRHAVAHAEARRHQRLATHEAIGLHLPELLAKHLRRDAWHRPLQFAKPTRARSEPLQDHRLPASADDRNRGVQRTGGTLLMAGRCWMAPGVLESTVLRLLRCTARVA